MCRPGIHIPLSEQSRQQYEFQYDSPLELKSPGRLEGGQDEGGAQFPVPGTHLMCFP